jgi:hypothetical protein
MLEQFVTNASIVGSSEASLWFVSWALRRKCELNKPLDSDTQALRWFLICGCYIVACLPIRKLALAEVLALGLGLALLCWPNIAIHIMGIGRKLHLTRPRSP